MAPPVAQIDSAAPVRSGFPDRTGCGAGGVWYGIPIEARPDVDQWMSHEHMAEGIARPGGWRGRRYRCEDPSDAQSYFGLYETHGSEALAAGASEAKAKGRTEWTERMAPHFRDLQGGTYAYTLSSGAALGGQAATLRFPAVDSTAEETRSVLRSLFEDDVCRHPRVVSVHLLEPVKLGAIGPVAAAPGSTASVVLVEALENDGIGHAIDVLSPVLSSFADGELRVQRWQLIFALTNE